MAETKAAEVVGKTDDNLMAALAHGSVIFGGVIIALIIWVTQKEKSSYVAFQSLQALVYQVVVGVVLLFIWFAAIILSFFVIGLILIPVALVLMVAAVGYGLYGAYETYYGKEFRYVLIGDFLEKRA